METTPASTARTSRTRVARRAGTAALLALALSTTLVACNVADASPRSAGTAPATGSTPSTTVAVELATNTNRQIIGCDNAATSQPTDIVFTCADGGVSMRGLTWAHWGAATATATGTLDVNLCEPSCADGKQESLNAVVELSGPTKVGGAEVYSSAKVTIAGTAPAGVDQEQTFELPTSR